MMLGLLFSGLLAVVPSVTVPISVAPSPTPTVAPTTTPTAAPTATPTAAPTSAPSGVHMLGNTGCQDFASNSMFNISEENAPVDSKSAQMIANAATISGSNGGLGIAAPKTFAVVPNNTTLLSIGANGRSTHPSSFPIPSFGPSLLTSGDKTMSLVETAGAPNCSFWEGYSFAYSGSFPSWTWTGYSGNGPLPSTGPFLYYPKIDGASGNQPCDGVADECAIELGANLNTWEANHGATQAILHTIHAESPSGMTCDATSNTNCIHVTGGSAGNMGMIRLHSYKTCPTTPNAAALCVAMKKYAITVDDNGCCWNLYTENESSADGMGNSMSIPSDITSFTSSLRVTDFEVIDPVWSGVY